MSLSEEQIKERLELFRSMQTVRDVAHLLDIKYSSLIYFIRILPDDEKYIEFNVRKKGGGERTINAPAAVLKGVQKRLNWYLQHFINPKICAHGFLYERSIKTNAQIHCNRQLVFNLDLENFFPSINFGRVIGLFKSPPFKFNPQVATILAQICCNSNSLPQGAPTSPVVSNFICSKLDGEMMRLCKQYRCFYSRYADDITFSINFDKFPVEFLKLKKDESISVGKVVNEIIEGNGFKVNQDKVRLQGRKERQMVTGLVVNKFPNVRRDFIRETRAMLHAWHKYGLDDAQAEFYRRFNMKYRNPEHGLPKYENVVSGRVEFIGMIKGRDNIVYQKLCRKLNKLYPEHGLGVKYNNDSLPLIVTEGGSDRMHLKSALRSFQEARLYHHLDIEFSDYRESMGDDELMKMCRSMARYPQNRRLIFVFDSDKVEIIQKAHDRNGNPRYWGNNVFSFCLPIPSHRLSTPNISIELYYKDDEIKTIDMNGRRLFLNTEFNPITRKHLTGDLFYKGTKVLLDGKRLFALDDEIRDKTGKNVALSKGDFALYVLNQENNFDSFDFSEFKAVFDLIESIIKSKIQ